MKEKKLADEIHNKFMKLDMPYYRRDKIIWVQDLSDYQTLVLDFIIPWVSFKSLFEFCKHNGFSLAFDNGQLEMCLYKISKIRKIEFHNLNQRSKQ